MVFSKVVSEANSAHQVRKQPLCYDAISGELPFQQA